MAGGGELCDDDGDDDDGGDDDDVVGVCTRSGVAKCWAGAGGELRCCVLMDTTLGRSAVGLTVLLLVGLACGGVERLLEDEDCRLSMAEDDWARLSSPSTDNRMVGSLLSSILWAGRLLLVCRTGDSGVLPVGKLRGLEGDGGVCCCCCWPSAQ